MADNVFAPDQGGDDNLPSDITVDVLVGETQKYKTPDDLAKAYVHAEKFIETLKREKQEAETRAQILEDLAKGQRQPANDQNANPDGNLTPPAGTPKENEPPVDLKSLIQEELNKANTDKLRADNVNAVSEKLANTLGGPDKARHYVNQKAAEMGIGVDFLMDTAAKSPQAFYNLIGLANTRPNSTPTPTSDFRRDAPNNGQKTFSDFEKIRVENPKLYWSRQIQDELFSLAAGNPNFTNT